MGRFGLETFLEPWEIFSDKLVSVHVEMRVSGSFESDRCAGDTKWEVINLQTDRQSAN